MDYADFEKRLTHSAKNGLDKAVYDYKQEIMKEAFSIAVLNHSEEEISLNNVIDAVRNLQKRFEKKAVLEEDLNESIKDSLRTINTIREKRKERIIQYLGFSTASIGILYILGGLFSSKNQLLFNFDTSSLAILVGFIALFGSMFSIFVIKLSRKNKEERKIESQRANDLILKLWSQIDYYGKVLLSEYLINNVSKKSKDEIGNINSSIDIVYQFLNKTEQDEFSMLLEVRNMIVHGDFENIAIHKKEEVITSAIMIIEKLKGMVKSDNPNATVTTQSFCKYT